MKRIRILFLFILLPVAVVQGQAPCSIPADVYSRWYFGKNGGLDFTGGGAPLVVSSSAMNTTGGVTAIADPNGKILFYSNGSTVWDSTNLIMPGGKGLSGDPTYSQSVIAVPDPGDVTKYYLITNGPSGVQYSVIDMTQNGGKGDVVSANNPLFSGTTQKLAAVADASGGVWIVTTDAGSGNFQLSDLTAAGFGPTVTQNVISPAQTVANGTLKFSSDGKKAALALPGQNMVQLFSFNDTTGTLTLTGSVTEAGVSDVEFSPDGTQLYTVNTSGGELAQFDLSSGSPPAKTVLSSVAGTDYNSLKLGPDGKIYVGLGGTANGTIGVVNAPNTAGASANYVNSAITMAPGTNAGSAFPNTIADYNFQGNFTNQGSCTKNPIQFYGSGYGDPSTWTWNFGDGTTAKGANPQHTYTNGGNYTVTLSYTDPCGNPVTITKTVTIQKNLLNLNLSDTTICKTPYTLDAGNPGATYLWSTGETTQTISISNAGKYWVHISQGGCTFADSVKIKVWGQGNKGNYKWYFGSSAGLDFSSNPPSLINTNADNTKGGTSSIADPRGNLLFYTDGIKVYNKNNQLMQNGTGLQGTGDTSQSTLIVPDPRSNNLYYIFSVNPNFGLSYSIVDLSYNNGLGKVTASNIPLTSPVAAKIAGVKDNNGNFWVVTHGLNDNQFEAYKVDTTGISTTPVVSAVGTTETSDEGYLKFSEDGTKAAVALKGQNTVEVYNFDKNTGKFSNPVTITNITTPYGLEFSSTDTMLYVSTNGNGNIYQYNLGAGNASAIMATKTRITTDSSISYEALQMGPDGRIYAALEGTGSGFLSVINNPDLDSANLTFQDKAVPLGTLSNSGLPNFVANHFTNSSWGILDQDTCFGMTTLFLATAPDSVVSWDWDFGDGTLKKNQPALISYPYSAPKNLYHVSVTAHPFGCPDTTLHKDVTIIKTPVIAIHDTTLCNQPSYTLDAGNNPGATYVWSTGQTGQQITTDTSGTYQVLADNGGCTATKSATITFNQITPVNLGSDITLCSGVTITLSAGSYPPAASYQWNTSAASSSIQVSTSGNYSVTVTLGSCSTSDDINVSFIAKPVVSFGPDLHLCAGDTKILDAGNYPGYTYLWSDNSSGQQLTVKSPGTYSVKVFEGNCAGGDTIGVTFNPLPVVQLPAEEIFCSENGDTVTLNPGGTAYTYLWTPGGLTTPTLAVTQEGTYTLQATDTIGCVTTISTLVRNICEAVLFVPTVFSPNGDGKNDAFVIHGKGIQDYYLEIFDRWGELIYTSSDMNVSWDGVYRGQIVQEGAYIWKIHYSGKTETGLTSKVKTGDVTVIR